MLKPTHTPVREEVLAYIVRHIGEKGYAPTIKEIAAGLGRSSTATIQYHLNLLEQEGRINRAGGGKTRSITVVLQHDAPCPLCGGAQVQQ